MGETTVGATFPVSINSSKTNFMRLQLLVFLALTALASPAFGQAPAPTPTPAGAGALPDSVTVSIHVGSDNPEIHQLMMRVLHIDKLHVEAHDPRLAGRLFHLTYQEFRAGVPTAEKELTSSAARLMSFDKQGNFSMDAFARQVTETTLENQFHFAAGFNIKTFTAQPGLGGRYSLRNDLWPYKRLPTLGPAVPGRQSTATHTFPTGRKLPFLVYMLPYEAPDGFSYYCDVAHSKVPTGEWFARFHIPHFVVYYLRVE